MMPKKSFLSGILSQKLAITPATLPPSDVDKNHPPIINAVNLGGDSLETKDKPIGLKHISLTVNTPYVRNNHTDEALCVYMLGTDITANTITNALRPEMIKAQANFLAVETGLPRLAMYAKNIISKGVNATIKNGLID